MGIELPEDQGAIDVPSGKSWKPIVPPIPILDRIAQRFLQEDREDPNRQLPGNLLGYLNHSVGFV
jgi:hypothetical protein